MNDIKVKNKKIMVACPLGKDTTKNGRDIAAALMMHGLNVTLFDMDKRKLSQKITPKPFRKLNYSHERVEFINSEIVKSIIDNKIDILFIIKPIDIHKETIELINAMGVITCSYWIDDPLDFSRSIINSKYFSICFTNDKSSIPAYKNEGVNIYHLPSAVAIDTFYPLNVKKKYNVSFIGTHAPLRKEILEKTNSNVYAFGPGWKKNISEKNNIIPCNQVFGKKTNSVYNQSIINLNIHMWRNVGTAMNLRLFEVPACNSFLLTDWVEEINDYFTPGINIETWQNIDELNDKIRFYLKNEVAMTKITKASYKHVLKNHTYFNRCFFIINEISKIL